MKVVMTELTPEEIEEAKRIEARWEAHRAGSPRTPISRDMVDKMTSGIVDPKAVEGDDRGTGRD